MGNEPFAGRQPWEYWGNYIKGSHVQNIGQNEPQRGPDSFAHRYGEIPIQRAEVFVQATPGILLGSDDLLALRLHGGRGGGPPAGLHWSVAIAFQNARLILVTELCQGGARGSYICDFKVGLYDISEFHRLGQDQDLLLHLAGEVQTSLRDAIEICAQRPQIGLVYHTVNNNCQCFVNSVLHAFRLPEAKDLHDVVGSGFLAEFFNAVHRHMIKKG
eukprot:TRINITY_DN81586_c0_g1_i1.p1 TRINITY_DN81586_c0_g1~~TRINITY_DN81586_c0_g1_i1.p1  ORF type:complete len:216 (-),score=4.49 TRINITY_DN81586_c0_g1_i1:175-822(-)